jgi:hypothetical protein
MVLIVGVGVAPYKGHNLSGPSQPEQNSDDLEVIYPNLKGQVISSCPFHFKPSAYKLNFVVA